jgi:hypothetical protein
VVDHVVRGRPSHAPMSEQARAPLDLRDRFVARFADFDVKALSLLFSIAAAWGIIRSVSLQSGPIITIFLAFAGLFASIGWVVQRRLLWRAEESLHDPALHRPAASSTGVRLHGGEPLSMAIFTLLTVVAVWNYPAPRPLFEPDVAMSASDEAGDVTAASDLIRAVPLGDGQQWVLVSPHQMQVVTLVDASDEGCPCEPDYGVPFEPDSYGQDRYAPLFLRHIPFDPGLP